jgi:hypothetical protein
MISYVKNKKEFKKYINSELVTQRRECERTLSEKHKKDVIWYFNGFCEICTRHVGFIIDWKHSNNLIPNYRERLVCPFCKLNSRQRFIGSVIMHKIKTENKRKKYQLYLMEQKSNFFKYFKKLFDRSDQVTMIGSEYLGLDIKSGEIYDGIRHEDAQALSFSDNFFDMIIANDVFEHIPLPLNAFAECFRVLKKDGELLMTIPFNAKLSRNIKRAELIANKSVKHLLTPHFHGNPISQEGSLVFYDFGWEVVDWLKKSGFNDVLIGLYWSYDCGYLGNGCQIFFISKRSL